MDTGATLVAGAGEGSDVRMLKIEWGRGGHIYD
jgi:hypothetical protein